MVWSSSMDFRYSITKELLRSFVAIGALEERLKTLSLAPSLRTSLNLETKIRSSHFSSKIEGNCLTLQQTEAVLKGKRIQAPKRDIQEIKNLFAIFDFLMEPSQETKPLTTNLICTIHRLVEKNIVRGKLLGRYRESQNAVFNATTGQVVYMPPEAKDVPMLMSELIDQLNRNTWEHCLITAAVAHFGLVTIHPFMDGNGRTARALSTLTLLRGQLNFVRLMAWDEYFFHHRQEYYHLLHNAQGDNFYHRNRVWDIQSWINFFVSGVEQAITNFLNELQTTELAFPLNHRQEKVLRFLKRRSAITNREYRELNKVSNFTAVIDLRSLETQGFIKRLGQGRSSRYVFITAFSTRR